MGTAEERREELKAVWRQAQAARAARSSLRRARPSSSGSGNADADLMFVGEAPGANEDKQGLPFVGQAGRLLETLLGEIGLERATSSSPTCSSAGRPATAIRCRRRSTTARTTCSASSS